MNLQTPCSLTRIETAVDKYWAEHKKPPKVAALDTKLLESLESSGSITDSQMYINFPLEQICLKVMALEEIEKNNGKLKRITAGMELPSVLCREGVIYSQLRRGLKKIEVYNLAAESGVLGQA